MEDIVIVFLIGAGVIVLACCAIMSYVVYRWRKDDVISIDNFEDEGDFHILKELSKNPKALRRVGREHAAGVYDNID